MRSVRSDFIDIAVTIRHQTDAAILVSDGSIRDEKEVMVWLPKSQVEINDDQTITLPEWLALEKGLI
jgi:hypothetical protein